MPLVDASEVEPLLASPCCKQALRTEEGTRVCVNCSSTFRSAGGLPVLICQDRSVASISDASDAIESQVPRRSSRWRKFLQPTNHTAARQTAELLAQLPSQGLVLVVGGGSLGQGLTRLYESANVIAFDIYASPHVQLLADGHDIPFADETFDAVVIQAVLEHVLDPARVVNEIHRVLRPGGHVYAETPFLQPVHEGAYDFQRFTESGHRWLFRRFESVSTGPCGGPAAQLVWSLNYFFRALFRSRRVGLVVRTLALPLLALDRLIPARHAIDAAAGTYFLGRKTAGFELTAAEIIAYYSGRDGRRTSTLYISDVGPRTVDDSAP